MVCVYYEYILIIKNGLVAQYGWIDHEPPPFSLLITLTNDMISYLSQNKNNGIAVHCKVIH